MNETTSMAAPHAAGGGEDGYDASAVSSALPPELVARANPSIPCRKSFNNPISGPRRWLGFERLLNSCILTGGSPGFVFC